MPNVLPDGADPAGLPGEGSGPSPGCARLSAAQIDELVRAHIALVDQLVGQSLSRLPRHVNRDDLVSAGMAGLAAAGIAFDPARGIPFGAFAAIRIRGAILDELRGMDWASRWVRSRAGRATTAEQDLVARLGRTPTRQELAAALDTTIEDLETLDEEVQRAAVLSLEGITGGAYDLVAARGPGPEALLLRRELIRYLRQAIEALPQPLRHIVVAHFIHERRTGEVAAELGLSESRVAALRTDALTLLRTRLDAQLDPPSSTGSHMPDTPHHAAERTGRHPDTDRLRGGPRRAGWPRTGDPGRGPANSSSR